jgi:hypothetical protein
VKHSADFSRGVLLVYTEASNTEDWSLRNDIRRKWSR